MSENGKGSNRRPQQVSREKFEENWDRIFNSHTYEEWLKDKKDEDEQND